MIGGELTSGNSVISQNNTTKYENIKVVVGDIDNGLMIPLFSSTEPCNIHNHLIDLYKRVFIVCNCKEYIYNIKFEL